MTTPQRWEPDTNLVAAVLSVPRTTFKLTDLNWHDRCWLVAGLGKKVLGEAGLTAQEIANRTRCSLRLVRDIRAEELTQGFVVAHKLNAALTSELSSERSVHSATRRNLEERTYAGDQLQKRFDQLIEAMAKAKRKAQFSDKPDKQGNLVKLCSKNHPIVGYNLYRYTDKNGHTREICRECNRQRVAKCRASKQKPQRETACNATALQDVCTGDS